MAGSEGHKHDANGTSLAVTAAILLVLTWISVSLRSYTRAIVMHCFQLDDWLMLISQAVYTLSCSLILAGVRSGIGHHNYNVVDQRKRTTALMALATATYVIDMMFIKLSIGVFLLRLSVQTVYKYTIWTSLIIITIWSSVIFLWDIFQCNPVAKQWDFSIRHGSCVAPQEVVHAAYAISVMTILSDWLYALLPIPMLWNVKMTKQAKATVIVILGLGIFASLATLIRLQYLANLNDDSDILYTGTDAMIWTLIEPGVAIVASSLATIRPLLRALRVRGFESTDRDRTPRSPRSSRKASHQNNINNNNNNNINPPTIGSGPPARPPPGPCRGLEDLYLRDMDDSSPIEEGPVRQEGTSRELENNADAEQETGILKRTEVVVVNSQCSSQGTSLGWEPSYVFRSDGNRLTGDDAPN